MKNFKFGILLLAIVAMFTAKANAAGVGYINYQKVQENYSFAIQAVKEVELKKIEAAKKEEQAQQKKEARLEQGRCKTFNELCELAKKRGYKNPVGWAYFIMKGRG